jgi:hypothetical protein
MRVSTYFARRGSQPGLTFSTMTARRSVVQRISNPMMLLRDITEVNGAMVVRHGVIAARIGRPADELKCLARS